MRVELKDRGAEIWAIRLVVVILLPVIVSGCNPPPHFEEIHLYDGPNLPTENLAVLQEVGWAPIHFFSTVRRGIPEEEVETIKNTEGQQQNTSGNYKSKVSRWEELYAYNRMNYKGESYFLWEKMFLLPGKYVIGAFVSYKYDDCTRGFHSTVDLQAGHLYVLKARGWIPFWGKPCSSVWLEDEATGEIVAGQDEP